MAKKILFIYTNYSTFVKTDFEILSSGNDVTKYQFKPVKGLFKTAFQFIKQLFYLSFNIWKFDAVFIWFADYHSFLPVFFTRLTGKKSFVVIGGYDVANLSEINYGSLSRPLRKRLTLFTYCNATLCLPVVEKLEEKLKQICPKAKCLTVHTGYQFQSNEKTDFKTPRENIILTVSITGNYQRFIVKGLDRFRELAENLPDYKFIIVGVKDAAKSLFEPIPKNLFLYPPVEQSKLIRFYEIASYYAQFSRSEGLPNALCEAMLYGCIPLGMNVGGIKLAANGHGKIINKWNANCIKEFINLSNDITERNKISKSVQDMFPISVRYDHLFEIIGQQL